MKHILPLLLCICMLGAVKAQVRSNINFDEIKKDISSPGAGNYASLVKRANLNDSTLTVNDYKYLYYGQVFQAYYSPYGGKLNADAAIKLADSDAAKAEKLIDALLAGNPANMDAIYDKALLLFKANRKAEALPYMKRFRGLLSSLLSSGDGKTAETAIVVACVPDEYQVMKYMKLKLVSQALLTDKKCDLMTVERIDQTGQAQLYFNIEKPLAAGMK